MGLNRNFWQGRRVLLTGHTGFKGSWLLLLLERLGAHVTGLSLPAPPESLFDKIDGAARCSSRLADIRELAAVETAVCAADPEVILHLAAQPLVRRSYADPIETFTTNVIGTANVLQAARRASNLRAIVSVTTDKCYANDGRSGPYHEDDRLGGHDPYSSSKACAELVSQCFRDSYFVDQGIGLATARAGNVIGGGDYSQDRLVPDLIRAFAAGCPPELRNPAAVRPWQHVLEPLAGYCLLAENLVRDPQRTATGWNFGPLASDFASVGQVAGLMGRHWNTTGSFAAQQGQHPHEAAVLTLDSTKAIRELSWTPRLSLTETVEWTASWYRRELAGEDAIALSFEQIDQYLALAAASATSAAA